MLIKCIQYKFSLYLNLVGKSSTPSTSKEFQPITEIALKTHDIIRLWVPFCSIAMKNTLSPDSTILTAAKKKSWNYLSSTFSNNLTFPLSQYIKKRKNPHERWAKTLTFGLVFIKYNNSEIVWCLVFFHSGPVGPVVCLTLHNNYYPPPPCAVPLTYIVTGAGIKKVLLPADLRPFSIDLIGKRHSG